MNNLSETMQYLIDGELSDSDRSKFLRSLDEEAPGRWRDLALGLMEVQLLEAGLQKRQSSVVVTGPARRRWWGVAAALLFGLGMGLLVSPAPPTSGGGHSIATDRQPELPHYGSVSIGSIGDANVEIPIVDATGGPADVRRVLHAAAEPVRQAREEFVRSGIEPELRTAYFSKQLDDGNHLVVPVSYLGPQGQGAQLPSGDQ